MRPRDDVPAATEVLEGRLARIVFARPETGWSVVRLTVAGRGEPVTAVGVLAGVHLGEQLRLTGRWVQDRRFGEQFAVASWAPVRPATLEGLERYLGSGLVPGVGPIMAERLVAHFGLDTLAVLDDAPERLAEVAGIGPARSRQIRDAWNAQRTLRDLVLALQAHGISTAHALRIHRAYGPRAESVLRADPYRLVLDVTGIGFATADDIARRLGLDPRSPRRIEAAVLHVLERHASEGHLFTDEDALVAATVTMIDVDPDAVREAVDALGAAGRLVLESDRATQDGPRTAWLPDLHDAEGESAAALAGLLAAEVAPLAVDPEAAMARLERARGVVLAPAQRAAVRAAVDGHVLVVTGGPGTGKTTLVHALLALFEQAALRVALCAPTGRAARRLGEATGRPAATMHRLLELGGTTSGLERGPARALDVDVVVVDEVSMVDQVLFAHLLRALPEGCRLVLVGDVDQLPSVGPGSVLAELIRSEVVPVVALREVFRQAEQSGIVVNAHRVNRGDPLALAADERGDFFFVERAAPEDILATVKSVVAERIPRRFGLDPMADVQVLTPMHRGLLGSRHLNQELQALLNPGPPLVEQGARAFRRGDRVMQLRNDYERELANGDLGRVVGFDEDRALLRVRFDEREVVYEAAELDALALAYACSIHKAQGSEYPCVVLALHTQHWLLLQRNLLYTAITRGRRLVVIVGSARAVALAIRTARADRRRTRLAQRLAARVREVGARS